MKCSEMVSKKLWLSMRVCNSPGFGPCIPPKTGEFEEKLKTGGVGIFAVKNLLKGQCHEIFCFWFFSWISFPQAPEYTVRAVSNFFENSRKYSQIKVYHQILPPVSLVIVLVFDVAFAINIIAIAATHNFNFPGEKRSVHLDQIAAQPLDGDARHHYLI